MCENLGMEGIVEEYKFHPTRKWRIDFAFPDIKLAIEQDGGVWAQKYGAKSRHFYGKGAIADMEKMNALAEDGWRVLKYQPNHIDFNQIKRIYDKLKENEYPCYNIYRSMMAYD